MPGLGLRGGEPGHSLSNAFRESSRPLAYYSMRDKGLMKTKDQLRHAIVEGAVKRLRPKFMTVAIMFMSLVPIMWSTGSGADVMKRIAAPLIGGIFTSFIMELVVYPAIYELWRWHFYVKKAAVQGATPPQ